MTIRILLTFFLLIQGISFAQENKTEEEKEEIHWKRNGKISAIFNQSAFSNWTSGGENNFALNITFNYTFNYTNGDFKWNNTIITDYGFTKNKNSDYTKKTNDRILLNSLIGIKTNGKWYFSGFINFRSQFAKGYKFGKDENGKETREQHTNFFSPAYLSFGPGMLWTKNNNLKVNFAPSTARFVFVDKDYTLPDKKYFGVTEGESYNLEFGLSIEGFAKFDIMKNVTLEHILFLYSDYLKEPENVDIDYTLNIIMGINKYLSANITFQTIYDDDAYRGFQLRELFGFGVNYSF